MDSKMMQSGDAAGTDPGPGLTRRQVLRNATGAGLMLLLPMLPAWAADSWVAAGKAADFTLNQPKRVALTGGGVVYITRLSADTLAAVSAKCTHRGCEVGWKPAESHFVCPCHGAQFAGDGKNLHGTTRRPDETLPALPVLPVRQKSGQVEINMGAVAPSAVVPG